MAMKNILVLTVLMVAGIQNLIKAETIRGIDIPRLDVARMAGKWYVLALTRDMQELACINSTIENKSADSYAITTTMTRTPDAIKEDPSIASVATLGPMTCAMEQDSVIVTCSTTDGHNMALVQFDADYDTYAVGYTTEKKEDIATSTDGTISILSRQLTLPNGILDKVKQSPFYQHGLASGTKFIMMNTSGCH